MKRNFKFFLIIWATLLVSWNVIIFIIRSMVAEYMPKFGLLFWIVWAFVIIGAVGNLGCAYVAFKPINANKMFYNIPLIKISWYALVCSFIIYSLLLLIPKCPIWIAIIVCVIVTAFNIIAVVKSLWAISAVDRRLKEQTSFIRFLTADAEGLMDRAKSDDVLEECKKVYVAARYSDPMSNYDLKPIEKQISAKMKELELIVAEDDYENAVETVKEIVILINDRNRKCKLMK